MRPCATKVSEHAPYPLTKVDGLLENGPVGRVLFSYRTGLRREHATVDLKRVTIRSSAHKAEWSRNTRGEAAPDIHIAVNQ